MRHTISLAKYRAALGTAILLAVCGLIFGAAGQTQAFEQCHIPPPLFHDGYVPSMGYGDVGARLYPCPRPTPPLVGHTYVTYQALMPQEFLYWHHRCYVTPHPDGRCTRTTVKWW
jgi:hypothetical protein